jgi:iron(II)-dependent oxidoreductase
MRVNASELLIADLLDARRRLLSLVEDLSDEELRVPKLATLNPPLWEIGHVAWFQEFWTLRHLDGRPPLRRDADHLWDSIAIAHDVRWDLKLPSRAETIDYMRRVLDEIVERLEARAADERDLYFHRLVAFHEDMHGEALVYTRQTLELPAPTIAATSASTRSSASASSTARSPSSARTALASSVPDGGPCPGDVEIAACTFDLGAARDRAFVFDNEKWAHPVHVAAFAIARAAVTQAEFLEFVEARGYERDELWSADGRRWRDSVHARHPVYWRRDANGRWLRRQFDQLVPLEEHKPVIHVCWYEADAYCNFKKRRLPSEAEWELAASCEPSASEKRAFPWGDSPPDGKRAALDLSSHVCADVGAHPLGDSAFGCRQMIGNVWEWTASDFLPYPGFVADPYKEYSAPWFGTHKVLRGGCFATRARLIRNTWRNFYTPDRRDVLAGFRTCAR